jgi:long-chain acyl-CoA synthetase
VLPAAVTGAALRDALDGERATAVIGVPRFYEALLAGLDDAIAARGRPARMLYRLALSAAVAVRRHAGIDLGTLLFGALRHRLSPDLRLLVSGGARLDPAVAWRLAGLGFDVRSGYGLAETASTHTANVPGSDRLGTEGKPFQDGEVRIDAPDRDGIGEILLRGPNVFDGYIEAGQTAASFTPDGWFRTGDLGRLDDGFLIVTGRVKETIVLGGGKKIDPEDLEKRYAQSPLIAELAVLEADGRLVALVRADPAAVAAAGHTRADGAVRAAIGEVAADLPDYQRLAGFALVRGELPRTRLGKLRRFLLPELYRKARAGEPTGAPRRAKRAEIDPALVEAPRPAAAWRLLQERYGTRLGGADDYLALDLGIDSLEWLNLVLALESRVGIDLSAANPGEITTVRGLLEAVGGAPAGDAAVRRADGLPSDAERWLGPVPRWQRRIGWLLLGLNRQLVRGFFPLRVDGLDHLAPAGPFVIACNHLSYLDAPALAAALPPEILRRTHWGAAEEQLPAPRLLHGLWRALNVFPLAETSPAVGLACARDALARDEVMTMFPEAWRSPDGGLQEFMPGIGHLVADTDIPVVPACLLGTFEALPRYRRWPRRVPLRVRFGAARSPGALAAAGKGETPAARIAAALHDAVAALGEPDEERQPSSSG